MIQIFDLSPYAIEKLEDAIKSDFQPGFRIPVSNLINKQFILSALRGSQEEYDKYFIDGNPWIYEFNFISWINSYPNFKGERDVRNKNALWISALVGFLNLDVTFNSKDSSSGLSSKHPDVILENNSVPFMRMNIKESNDKYNETLLEMMSSFFPSCYSSFPKGSDSILGAVSTRSFIGLYRIQSSSFSLDKDNPIILTADQYEYKLIKKYNISTNFGRMEFFLQMIKICRWVVSITKKNANFTLIPQVNIQTENGHSVVWNDQVIIKSFDPEIIFKRSKDQLDYIEEVYAKKLPNIGWGEVNSEDLQIKITRIGTPLRILISTRKISKKNALAQIEEGISQLKKMNFAHCDLKLDNIYGRIERKKVKVFIDDLEYLTKLNDPAPKVSYCYPKTIPNNFTAWDLHLRQFSQLSEEINGLWLQKESVEEPQKKKRKLT